MKLILLIACLLTISVNGQLYQEDTDSWYSFNLDVNCYSADLDMLVTCDGGFDDGTYTDVGRCYVYEPSGSRWSQTQTIEAPLADRANSLSLGVDGARSSSNEYYVFERCSMHSNSGGDWLVIGSSAEKVFVYKLNAGTWTDHQTLTIPSSVDFGTTIGSFGDHIFTLAQESSGSFAGVTIFEYNSGTTNWDFLEFRDDSHSGDAFFATDGLLNVDQEQQTVIYNKRGGTANEYSFRWTGSAFVDLTFDTTFPSETGRVEADDGLMILHGHQSTSSSFNVRQVDVYQLDTGTNTYELVQSITRPNSETKFGAFCSVVNSTRILISKQDSSSTPTQYGLFVYDFDTVWSQADDYGYTLGSAHDFQAGVGSQLVFFDSGYPSDYFVDDVDNIWIAGGYTVQSGVYGYVNKIEPYVPTPEPTASPTKSPIPTPEPTASPTTTPPTNPPTDPPTNPSGGIAISTSDVGFHVLNDTDRMSVATDLITQLDTDYPDTSEYSITKTVASSELGTVNQGLIDEIGDNAALQAAILDVRCGTAAAQCSLTFNPSSRRQLSTVAVVIEITFDIDSSLLSNVDGLDLSDPGFEDALATALGLTNSSDIIVTSSGGDITVTADLQGILGADPLAEDLIEVSENLQSDMESITDTLLDALGASPSDAYLIESTLNLCPADRDCSGNGTCDPATGVCTCVGDWWGINCETPCVCNNGGDCVNAYCQCLFPYYGLRCDDEKDCSCPI